MQARTKRQREVLTYITSFIDERGYEPSYQQIARHFRIASKSAIAKHVAALESQGFLQRHRDNGSFGLSVRPNASAAESVCEIQWLDLPPDLEPREPWELEPLYVPRLLVGFSSIERIAAFRVRDDAMIDDHILEGDIVLAEKRSYARDGDTVIVVVEDKTVAVSSFFRSGANVELRFANPGRPPVHLSADRVAIQGTVRGLIRRVD